VSTQDFDEETARAGQLGCVCGPGESDDGATGAGLYRLAAGFGLSVLAQALVLSVLPEAGRLLDPSAARIGWPFALSLVGAAAASFPAAFLVDAYGRRSAFALGASLGVAGGLIASFALAHDNFAALCLGAFWLGLAQGFSLFYRHAAARGPSAQARGGLVVLAGGAGAALLAPAIIALGGAFGGGGATTLLCAAALHVAALGVAVRLPHALGGEARAPCGPPTRAFVGATLAGALAWFVMSAVMLHGPLAMAVCSASPVFIGGAMAWHLLAMYAPAALAARWPGFGAPVAWIGAGLLAMIGGALTVSGAGAALVIAVAMLLVGAGWSLVNIGALRLLHEGAHLPRYAFALHDVALLVAATAGALAR
jgi:MFS family permease